MIFLQSDAIQLSFVLANLKGHLEQKRFCYKHLYQIFNYAIFWILHKFKKDKWFISYAQMKQDKAGNVSASNGWFSFSRTNGSTQNDSIYYLVQKDERSKNLFFYLIIPLPKPLKQLYSLSTLDFKSLKDWNLHDAVKLLLLVKHKKDR